MQVFCIDFSHIMKICCTYTSFKAVLLGQWHSLSDPELEHSLITRIDFNLFCRFDELSIPDYSTLCRYRNRRRKTTPCPNCWS